MNPRDMINWVKKPTGAFILFCVVLATIFFAVKRFLPGSTKPHPQQLTYSTKAAADGGQNITKGTIKSLTAKAMTGAAASGGAAAAVAGMTALETLVTASINEGRGGDSVVGSLARMRNSFRDKDNSSGGSNQNPRKGGIPAEDVSGDKTVGDLIRKSKNPES